MKKLLLIGVLAVAMCATSCTKPRFITHMTHRDKDNTMKFVTYQERFLQTPDYQVFKCNTEADGRLFQCRAMTLTWNLD